MLNFETILMAGKSTSLSNSYLLAAVDLFCIVGWVGHGGKDKKSLALLGIASPHLPQLAHR
jgi:hypothetical protein